MKQYKLTGFNTNLSHQCLERLNKNFIIDFPVVVESDSEPFNEDTMITVPNRDGILNGFFVFWFNWEPLENTPDRGGGIGG